MKKTLYALFLIVLFIGGFAGGAIYSHRAPVATDGTKGGRQVLYYVDPMNPSHTSKEPGFAPCGMALEPVYADSEFSGDGASIDLAAMPPGTVRISPTRQQMIGVRVEAAEVTSQTHSLRTLGRIAPDENRTYRMLAAEDGWMWNIHEGTTGSVVHKDQLLATLYNYLFLARQQQYLYALDLADRKAQSTAARATAAQQMQGHHHDAGQSDSEQAEPPLPLAKGTSAPQSTTQLAMAQKSNPSQFNVPLASYSMVQTNTGGVNPAGGVYYINDPLELAKLELYNLGVGDFQMDEIARIRKVATDLEVRSPVTGIVLARNVSPMQKFQKGSELFRVADISRVWVYADVFWREANQIRPGMRARVTLPEQDTVFDAYVADIPSQFDPGSRALRVRLEADNPDLELRPDMFVDVDFLIDLPPALIVPTDAVIDTGSSRTVFVSLGDGFFQPRSVKTGWRFADQVEIKEGLMPGEQIVVSGNFLINSESRMKLAAAGFLGCAPQEPSHDAPMTPNQLMGNQASSEPAPKAAVTTAPPAPAPHDVPAPSSKLQDTVRQVAMPQRDVTPPARPATATIPGISRCLVCGMIVYENKAKASGHSHDHAGTTHFFCSSHCRDQFAASPQRYLPKEAETTARDASSTRKGTQVP